MRRTRPVPRISLGDRLAAAVAGVVVGGLIGMVLAWVLGVYSSTLGPSHLPVDFRHWVVFCAAGFGLVGLLVGPFVGTLMGLVIHVIFRFEQAGSGRDHDAPAWLVVVLVVAIVLGVGWSAR